MRRVLDEPPGERTDRALWQGDAVAFGFSALFEDLWERTEIVRMPREACEGDPAGVVLGAERAALDLLLREQALAPARQKEALAALRSLLHGNVVAFDPTGTSAVPPLAREPTVLTPDDVRYELFRFREGRSREPPFQVVSRQALARASARKKSVYVARPPEWEDVVHGRDPEIKFIERDQTDALFGEVERHLLGGLGEGRKLPALFVLGAPGAGKSTLVRRVAARIVQEGRAVVAAPKLNLARIDKDEFEPFLAELEALAAGSLPVLLVLDDPFFDGSGWVPLLARIAKSSSTIAVLGASPDYLYEKFGHELGGKQIDCRTFEVAGTTAREKAELCAMHGCDPAAFGDDREDFLVLTMEAAAGHSFEQIVDRIWMTLNDGEPIRPHARPEDLPWPVRAYLIACLFHRMDLACPAVLMRAALLRSGRDRPAGDYEIGLLTTAQVWKIFRVFEPEAGYLEHLGERIATAHKRIAIEAWRQRPLPAWNPADWLAPASLDPDAECAVMQVGELAAKLSLTGDRADGRLVELLIRAWNDAAREGRVEPRNVGLLHSALSMRGKPSDAARLRPALEACAARLSPQSWLAALALSHGAPPGAAKRAFTSLDLAAIIGVADFHVAPKRAAQLLRALKDEPALRRAFVERILATADHPNAYKMLHVLAVLDPASDAVLRAVEAWLDAYPDLIDERRYLLAGVLSREGAPDALLCRAEAYVAARHLGREHIATLLLAAGRGSPRYIDVVVGLLLEESGSAREHLFDRLARQLAAQPAAAMDYLAAARDPRRSAVVLDCLAARCARTRRGLAALLAGARKLDDAALRALLARLFEGGVAGPTRHFLLAMPDLDPRVRDDLAARPATG